MGAVGFIVKLSTLFPPLPPNLPNLWE
jgi:hypothetical protein